MTMTRRGFNRLALASLTAAGFAPRQLFAQGKPNSTFGGVKVGCITAYSYHNMPNTAEDILRYLVRDGISWTEMERTQESFAGAPASPPFRQGPPGPEQVKFRDDLLQWRLHAPMEKFTQLRKMYNDAGVNIYGFKTQLDMDMPDGAFDYSFNAAKACGADQVTMELPDNPALTKRMGEFASKHKMMVGYHAHMQASPTAWDMAMSQSPYNGINIDIGHFIAAGNTSQDLLSTIRKNHARIASLHIKDRMSKEHGGKNMPWGEGDTPVKDVLLMMKNEHYTFPATIELEYAVPAGSDSEKEIVRCVQYAKNILTA